MKVHMDGPLRPHLSFDEMGYLTFLREHGIEESETADLSLCVLLQFGTDISLKGTYWSVTNSISVYLPVWREVELVRLNLTLLHETHHFIQECQGRDFEKEYALPYEERPYEREAWAFADSYGQKTAFLAGSVTLRLTGSVRHWWT